MSYGHWAWVVRELDGTEGVIAAELPFAPGLGVLPLCHPRREIVEVYESLARAHEARTGRPVRLVHLVEVDE